MTRFDPLFVPASVSTSIAAVAAPLAFSPAPGRRRLIAAGLVSIALAGCGGGGGSNTPAADASAAPQTAGGTTDQAGSPGNGQAANAAGNGAGNGASNGASNGATNPAAAPAAAPAVSGAGNNATTQASASAPARLADFAYYRLGTPGPAGTASLRGDTLAVDGRQSSNARLVAGACNGGTGFPQCASAASANVFTLCSSDGGGGPNTHRVRSRYVLFDPAAQRITDASVLRNITFSGYEDCAQDNVGAQPKSAPSARLSFNAAGDLTLVRYDQDPARSSTLPAFFVNLNSDTVSGGQTARFNVYRSNGRYVIIATSAPTAGVTAADPGTLIAFVQD